MWAHADRPGNPGSPMRDDPRQTGTGGTGPVTRSPDHRIPRSPDPVQSLLVTPRIVGQRLMMRSFPVLMSETWESISRVGSMTRFI